MAQGFALNGHSTSLVAGVVSAINPRVIFIRIEDDDHELTLLAFARGERLSEIVVRDRATDELRFYAGRFSLACDGSAHGCSPGDRFTPAFEAGWTEFNMYAEEDVENSPLDCRVCHQPQGPGTPRILRMQEFDPPWNHWFYRNSDGGLALLGDYESAKGDERFAGIGFDEIFMSQPGLLSATIYFAGTREQPNAFVSADIEREVRRSARGQPGDNAVAGRSATWDTLYERAKRGEAISVPYHDVKVTDPDKLAAMTAAYRDYSTGDLEADALPDLAQVFPDDPLRLAHMGFLTEPGLEGDQVLLQACAQCHNGRLDQSISRARFDVDLSRMGREAKDRAIARITLPPDDPAVMPPAGFRRLSREGRDRLVALLRR